MKFEDIFKHRNIQGNVYLCGCHVWLGFDYPLSKAKEIQKKIGKIIHGNIDSQGKI